MKCVHNVECLSFWFAPEKLCYLQVANFVENVGAPRNTLKVELALVYGGAHIPAVLAVDAQIGIHVRLVGERTLYPCGPNDSI